MAKNAPAEAPATAVISTDPELARAEVDRLNGQELKFAGLYRDKVAELAEVKANRGRQVLLAGDPTAIAGEVNKRIRELEDELEAIAEAAMEARLARLDAIPEAFIAAAAKLEQTAAQLEAEADTLQAESDRLRLALEKHDECSYQPAGPKIAGDGSRPYGGPSEGGAPIVYVVAAPCFLLLRDQAAGLRRTAAELRYKQPHRAGSVEADSTEALFALVHADPMRVGPAVGEIGTWAERATEELRRRRQRINHGDGFVETDAPIAWHLEWRNGVIDLPQSMAFTPSTHSAQSNAFNSDDGFESAAEAVRIQDVEDVPLGGAEVLTR